ncbi:MAG TPA: hypothetical protein PLR91_01975, partial [Kiritimatiellia bacterium]|nr:hypothetical protein [Kiritimatiellia bacterium]
DSPASQRPVLHWPLAGGHGYEREMKKNRQSAEIDPPVPRQYSLVKVAQWYLDFLKEKKIQDCPLSQEKTFIFLGEIPNMQGHCVVVGQKSGKVFCGYHIEDFIELTEDET